MDLWQLRTFVAVAKNLNFTRASEELNLTQPAVSHQIKVLETELGDKVFERSGNKIELTRAGEMFADYAKHVLATTDELKKRIGEQKETEFSTVRTAASTRSLDAPFAKLKSDFQKVAPEIELSFTNFPTAGEVLSAVENDSIDVAMTELRPKKGSAVTSVPYGLFEIVLISSPDHPLATKSKIDLHQLQHAKWALLDENDAYGKIARDILKKNSVDPASVFSTNDGTVIEDMVVSGSHVSMLFNIGVTRSIGSGQVVALDVPELKAEMQVYVVWKESNAGVGLDTFLKFILEYPLVGMRRRDLGEASDHRRL